MSISMGVREFRESLTKTLRRVRAGETVEITHDGVPVALVTPLPATAAERLVAEGSATPPAAVELPSRRHPVVTGVTASAALAREREE
jgi:prevent-host-death family protein